MSEYRCYRILRKLAAEVRLLDLQLVPKRKEFPLIAIEKAKLRSEQRHTDLAININYTPP